MESTASHLEYPSVAAPRRRRQLKYAIARARFPYRGTLARGYLRAAERYRSLRAGSSFASSADGLPVPPARLRVLVCGTPTLDWFMESGRAQANYLREIVTDAGQPLDQMGAILDLGCGCGRISRWFADVNGPEFNGCDYNNQLVAWCSANLKHMNVTRNRLRPPLPYPDGAFDFLFVYSVFTHLSTELATLWMAEIARVTKAGGLIWFTVHGASYRERLAVDDRDRFDNGDVVVWLPEIEGTNLCCSYWSEPAARMMLSPGFETLVHLDPKANPALAKRVCLTQDAYLVRRPAR